MLIDTHHKNYFYDRIEIKLMLKHNINVSNCFCNRLQGNDGEMLKIWRRKLDRVLINYMNGKKL